MSLMDLDNNVVAALEKHIQEDKENAPTYNKEFFENLQKYRPTYHFIADIIIEHLAPKSIVDWGCGCGYILEKLKMRGIIDLAGVEGSEAAKPFIPESLVDHIIIADVLLVEKIGYDLAITIEVGEHLKISDSGRFVNAVCSSANKWIWFSAAQPGQVGTGHINLQPLCFWIDVFKEVGLFEPDWEKTYKIKQAMLQNHKLSLGFPWLRDNLLIFRRI
jgi:hypothetical protein